MRALAGLHKAWPFTAPAHTPSTIDIRAYAQSGEGDDPARPRSTSSPGNAGRSRPNGPGC